MCDARTVTTATFNVPMGLRYQLILIAHRNYSPEMSAVLRSLVSLNEAEMRPCFERASKLAAIANPILVDK